MNETLRQLIRIQELEFALSEQTAVNDEAGARDLDAKIRSLLAELPDAPAVLFSRLRARDPVAVVPMHHGSCSACGFVLPTAQVGIVRSGARVQQCQNCQRILYHPEDRPAQPRIARFLRVATSGPTRFSSARLMHPALASESRQGVLAEIIEGMAAERLVDEPATLLELALDRERLASTALGNGLAFPHVRGVEGGGMVFALGLKSDGLHFDPDSARPSRIIVFTIVPDAASGLYVQLVADLLKALRHENAQERLLTCETGGALWRTLVSLTRQPKRSKQIVGAA